MKAILLSIKPKWVAKILNGEKSIEVRKNKALYKATMKLIEEQGYATFFMYCTKDNKTKHYCFNKNNELNRMNGKVVAKFTVRKVDKYPFVSGEYDKLIGSCLSKQEIIDYQTVKFDKELNYRIVKTIYAYHIEDLEIFDEPKKLSEFTTPIKIITTGKHHHFIYGHAKPIIRAPQNFCYVQSEYVESEE